MHVRDAAGTKGEASRTNAKWPGEEATAVHTVFILHSAHTTVKLSVYYVSDKTTASLHGVHATAGADRIGTREAE